MKQIYTTSKWYHWSTLLIKCTVVTITNVELNIADKVVSIGHFYSGRKVNSINCHLVDTIRLRFPLI